ncbi:unnamed protein product [Arctogadus glacialis]
MPDCFYQVASSLPRVPDPLSSSPFFLGGCFPLPHRVVLADVSVLGKDCSLRLGDEEAGGSESICSDISSPELSIHMSQNNSVPSPPVPLQVVVLYCNAVPRSITEASERNPIRELGS